ncbi:AAA family ATPase [Apilactobacillus timberlakei]|uniref:DUF4435 domain-containing protein n=1 Tax=Apilactobacillus timberlakei TaxID=2008380 RepID=A0ABY2YV11_9LACO|nr:DUF4435 domain-containing protein [Apilactobacillus timberlakei]TPR14671.1 DUF4435 domain-containing protein [Apilactobacillus timberlakei]TPR15998.1 DUF4435 domain-containing protein [Apilactobacillus timberlakei]
MQNNIESINNQLDKLLEHSIYVLDNADLNIDEKKVLKEEFNSNISLIQDVILNIKNEISRINISTNYDSNLKDFLNKIISSFQINDLKTIKLQIKKLLNESNRLYILSKIAIVKRTAVIVGANGSGKSTFVNSLYGSNLSNLTVIPAQKVLYFEDYNNNISTTSINDYRNDYLRPVNNDFKTKIMGLDIDRKLVAPFTALITALINDLSQNSNNQRNLKLECRTKSNWDKLYEIWKKLIPEISFDIDSFKRTIIPVRNGNRYSLNELSDGEKCILFYIANVLLANKNSYIIVDEPETFLNPAIYNKLWDKLLDVRSDCQFIFTSHNIEFISARLNSTIIWCKKFTPPNNVELHPLENNELPNSLLTELIGSRKKILFCEGSLSSYDYRIFSKIFMDDYTIKPVKGHDQVIEYTKTFNKLPRWVENSAIGIIDQDGLEDKQIKEYKNDNVFCLPYNEIEMILLDETVIKKVLNCSKDIKETNDLFNCYKNDFFERVKEKRNEIIYNIAKNRLDSSIKRSFIDSKREKRNLDNLINNVNDLPNKLNPKEVVDKISKQLRDVIKNKDYRKMLKMCTLKGEILKDMANKLLQADYANFAIGRISKDESLRKYLRKLIKK